MKRKEIWLISLSVLLALGIRLLLIFTYQPLYGNDAPSYAALAEMIRTGDFTGYDGVRTPGYPLFMLMCGMDNHLIRIVQNICGLVSIWLVYLLVRPHVSRVTSWGLVLFLAVSIQFPFYEAIIQTESLAMVAILGSLYFFVTPSTHHHRNIAIVGVMASIGALIRPHLIILPPLFLANYAWQNWGKRRQLFSGLFALALPSILLVGSWVLLNYAFLSRITFTTLPKADIMAHMIHYVSDADDKYGPVKSAYYAAYETMRDEVEASDDNRAGYTSYAAKLLREQGIEMSLDLKYIIHEMAIDLIRKHPAGYLKNVIWAWFRFWRVHIIVYPENFIRSSQIYGLVTGLWLTVKASWFFVNILFLIFLPVLFVIEKDTRRQAFIYTIYSMILAASASQAITQYYDNARFAVPFQPAVAIAVVVGASIFRNHKMKMARAA